MNIRKYWLDAEIYIYAIDDDDQRIDTPTKTDFYIGRKGYAALTFSFGIPNDENYPKDEKQFIENLYQNGYFDYDIAELNEI